MEARRRWAARSADQRRRAVILEPRGHIDMAGAVLTEPTQPGSHAGVLFMDSESFPAFAVHAVLGVAAIARARGLLVVADDAPLVFDTSAGAVRVSVAAPRGEGAGVVTMTGVPSFVLHAGVDVPLPGRRVRADVAFSGAFYAIVDAESAGVPVDGGRLGDLRRVGRDIVRALEAAMAIEHPVDPARHGLHGVVFTAPPQAVGADLRLAAVSAAGVVDRSPACGATPAIMAVLHAMGLLDVNLPFTPEGIVGTVVDSRIERLTRVGDVTAIVPSLTAPVWLTGEHTFFVAEDDPLGEGFRLG